MTRNGPGARTDVLVAAWALGRLPGVLLVLYLVRRQVLEVVEQRYGLEDITHAAIDLLSTPLTRAIHFVMLSALLVLIVWATRRMKPARGYVVALAATMLLIWTSVRWFATQQPLGSVAVLIVVTNLAPDAIFRGVTRLQGPWRIFMTFGVGVAEILLSRRYLEWVARTTGWAPFARVAEHPTASVVPGLLFASLVATAGIDGRALVPSEQALRSTPGMRIVDQGDFNWLERDSTGRYLLVTGHGLNRLRRYDLSDLSASPLESEVPTGASQAFAYDSEKNEVYVYDAQAEALLYLDATTLTLRRSVSVPGIAEGDSWLAVDRLSDSIAIASEQDSPGGVPYVVLNRTTGAIVDRQYFDSGNLLLHPTKPYVYLSSFRRSNDLKLYDLSTRKLLTRSLADGRSHRMAYWAKANQVLLASSVEARVQRFDADTLVLLGYFGAPFGVRAVAVDEERNLMLCASSTGGQVTVVALDTGQTHATYYLGPWLRSIALDVANGIAYVSSNGALYMLPYARSTGASAMATGRRPVPPQ